MILVRRGFDAVIITAAAPRVPPLLVEQGREGDRLVMPLGSDQARQLARGLKRKVRLAPRAAGRVFFVPTTGAVRATPQSPPAAGTLPNPRERGFPGVASPAR